MGIVVLASASGSPGVTTTTLGLAFAWPRPVLVVEADPAGGSGILAGLCRGRVDPGAGLIDLALAHRQGRLAEALPVTLLHWPESSVMLLPGVLAHQQAHSLAGLWGALLDALRAFSDHGRDDGPHAHRDASSHAADPPSRHDGVKDRDGVTVGVRARVDGVAADEVAGSRTQDGADAPPWVSADRIAGGDEPLDVLVDAGRLGLEGWPAPLISGADLTLLVTRNTLPVLAGAQSWAVTLRSSLETIGGEDRLGLVVVDESDRWARRRGGRVLGPPRVRPYGTRQVAKTLQLPVLASLPWAPEGADCFSHGAQPPPRWDNSQLARSYRAMAEALVARLDTSAAELAAISAVAGAEL